MKMQFIRNHNRKAAHQVNIQFLRVTVSLLPTYRRTGKFTGLFQPFIMTTPNQVADSAAADIVSCGKSIESVSDTLDVALSQSQHDRQRLQGRLDALKQTVQAYNGWATATKMAMSSWAMGTYNFNQSFLALANTLSDVQKQLTAFHATVSGPRVSSSGPTGIPQEYGAVPRSILQTG